ncbi:hypothetical protein [Frankia sp. Cj5]|uniref:hypothetical protein n=1 Tax=Frankia sp. Cj5 TaxID=2880978 RepID=UPI001EF4B8BE|nr:hypothetical protein [Frankia sp. Cj5]
MTAVAVNRDPMAQEPQDRPLGQPLDITGLVEWPLPVGRVDFDEGLAYLHAVDPCELTEPFPVAFRPTDVLT